MKPYYEHIRPGNDIWIGVVFGILGLVLLAIWLGEGSGFYVEQEQGIFLVKREVRYWPDHTVSDSESRYVAEYVVKYLNEQGLKCY